MIRKTLLWLLFVVCWTGSTPLLAQQNATDDLIKSLQARVKRAPEDYAGYAGLGAAYLQKGRETADAADYELAKNALETSLELLSNDPAAAFAMTQMAVVCMVEHRFEDALTWARGPWRWVLATHLLGRSRETHSRTWVITKALRRRIHG